MDLLNLSSDDTVSMEKDCPRLLEALESWRKTPEVETPYLPSATGLDGIQVSFRHLDLQAQSNTLIFVNDVSSIRDSMQQAKLASLGHLTMLPGSNVPGPACWGPLTHR